MTNFYKTLIEKQIPIENEVIGSLLVADSYIEKSLKELNTTDFYHTTNQVVFSAINKLYHEKGIIDIKNLYELVRGKLGQAENTEITYLSQFMGEIKSETKLKYLIGELKSINYQRAIFNETEKFRQALEKGVNFDDAFIKLKSIIDYTHQRENWYKLNERGGLKVVQGRLADHLKNEHYIIYCNESFYMYTNGFYKKSKDNELKQVISQHVQLDIQTSQTINGTLELLRAASLVEDVKEDFNKINCLNGILDTISWSFKEHSPGEIFLSQFNVNYNPDSKAPKWLKALSELLPEEQLILLQEIAGNILVPDLRSEKVFFLLGSGGNGKSTFLEPFQKMLGGACSDLSIQDLEHEFKLSGLVGRRSNICTDIGNRPLEKLEILKKLVSGEAVFVNEKHKPPFSYKNRACLVFAANEMPFSNDSTDGFFRRLAIINFNKKPLKKDINLKEYVIENELPGVLNWAIEGLKRLRSNNGAFTINNANDEVMEEIRANTDSIYGFFYNCCEFDDKAEPKATSIFYNWYETYCDKIGRRPKSYLTFCKDIKRMYPDKVERKGGKNISVITGVEYLGLN